MTAPHLLRDAQDGRDPVDHRDRHVEPAITGSETGIAVKAAAAQSLKVTGFPTTDTAGTANNFTVTAYDPYGNIATGYTGTVHFTSSDSQATLPANYTFTAADTAAPHLLGHAQDGRDPVDHRDRHGQPAITGSETGITVTAAAATR